MLVLFFVVGCGGATRSALPQTTTTTSAVMRTQEPIEGRTIKMMVGEKGSIAMVAKSGCVSMVNEGARGDEMAVRCTKPERIAEWLAANDPIATHMPMMKVDEDDDRDIPLPAAQILTSMGDMYRVERTADVEKLIAAVHGLSKELVAHAEPAPGPATSSGWQMMRVSGPAHVSVAGTMASGVLDARVSSNGQYLCEFVTDGLHATKSGMIPNNAAPRVLEDVLGPFQPGSGASPVVAIAMGKEQRANAASSREVIERFGPLQDALGDACLPELEGPGPIGL